MRNILKWASLAVLLTLFSCAKAEYKGEIPEFTKPGVYGSITPLVDDDEPSTKATIVPSSMGYRFAEGDRINIWSQSGTLLIYYVASVGDGGSAVFDGDGFTLADGKTYYSSVPVIRKVTDSYHALSMSYEGQVQTENNNANHVADYTYTHASATCADGKTAFSYARYNGYFRFYITLPEALTLTELSITADDDSFFTLNGTADISAGSFTAGDKAGTMTLKLGESEDGITVSDKELGAFLSVAPCAAGEYIIRVKDSAGNVYTSPKISKTALEAGHYKTFTTEVFPGENPAVAKIGETVYFSLVDAVAAVPTDGTQTTITMIGEETIDVVGSAITVANTKNIILDLNGHNVVGVAEGGSTNALITNKGTLTIKDSSDTNKDGTGNGKLISGATTNWIYNGDGNYSGSYASNTISNSGTLTVESGYLENMSTGSAAYAVDNNSTAGNAILNVNGGKLTAVGSVIRQFCNSTTNQNAVNISGGIVETNGYTAMWTQLPGSNASSKKLAALNITGGVIKGRTYAWYDYSFGDSFEAVNYSISGGQFDGDLFSYAVYNDVKPGFITGGVFASKTYVEDGETYDCDWPSLIADGYIEAPNTDPATMSDYPYTVVVDTNEYVAKIGNTKYLTLEAAFAAAEDGDVITLLEDCEGNGIIAPQGKFATNGLTVDFAGHTYDFSGSGVGSTGTEYNGFQLLMGNTITFTNGTLTASSEDAGFLIQNYSNLTLDNMTVDGSDIWGGYVISNNNGNVVINDTEIIAPTGDFAFDVCRYASYPSVNVTVKGSSVINGDIEVSASSGNAMDGFSLMVESGTINGDLVVDGSAATAMSATPEKALIKKDNDVELDAPSGFKWVDNNDGTSTLKGVTNVAKIGSVEYESLADAIAAVPANTQTTITMIGNETIEANAGVTIPADKNIILDLNSKTIKGVVQSPATAQVILNKGTLTITDSSNETSGTLTNEVSDENAGSPMDKNWYSNVITNNGTLTVNAGNIVNTGTGGACYAIDNITNGTSCTPTVNIAGGNISAKKVAVRMFCNSTTNVNTVNVTGGNISSELAYGIQTQQANTNANKAALNISGGTISGQYAWCDYGDKNTPTQFDNTTYSITGGYFTGSLWSYATYYCGMDGFISGGYFNQAGGGDLVISGFAFAENTDEETKETYPYTIGLAEVYYSWIDGGVERGEYCPLSAPFVQGWLMDGEFITLQKNVTLTETIACQLESGCFSLTLGAYNIIKGNYSISLKPGVSVKTDKQTDIFSAEDGSQIVETAISDGDFHYMYSVASNVAKIGDVEYLTLEAAFAAVQDGQTITLMADCAGNGIQAPQGKFTSGVTVDFNGFTYTMDGEMVGSTGTQTQAFQLLKDNKITFKNGTITSAKAKMLVQNYSDLTLDKMTLTLNNPSYSSAYTLSNNNGNVTIKDTEINANPAGGFAFDVCRYSSYPSVSVTVKGSSVINGNVEFDAGSGNPMNGVSLTIEAGTISGNLMPTSGGVTALTNSPDKAVITKSDAVTLAAPSGFQWVSNGDGTSTLSAITKFAKIGDVEYDTLEAAFAAVQDGQTITLVADCSGNGIQAPQGKFTTGVTVDFNGYKYTMDGEMVGSTGTQTQAFQLLKDNTITFKNGTIESSKALMLIQNYSNLTLENMTLKLNTTGTNNLYTLSNNNGNVLINNTTINAAPTTNSFAFDVCRYASYSSVSVTVRGNSYIAGDIEISASSSDPKDGFSFLFDGGTVMGSLVIDQTAKNAMISDPDKVSIRKNRNKSLTAPYGFTWAEDSGYHRLVVQ